MPVMSINVGTMMRIKFLLPCSQRRTSMFGGIASFLAAICVKRVVFPILEKKKQETTVC